MTNIETTKNRFFGKVRQVSEEEFEGSIWEKLGYDRALCPVCETHLRNGICLNACHLSGDARKGFNQRMRELSRKMEGDDG